MSNLDISMLSLTKNTYFYRAKDHDINHVEILDCASRNCQEGKEFLINTVKENIEINEKSYLYSLRIFPSERTVYFINSQDKEVKFSDIIHAYIILIERDDFLAVLSKSCSSISKIIDTKFELLSNLGNNSLVSQNAEYQRLSLRNMTISDKAIRARSYEDANLNGVLSLHGAGRSIPSHIRVRENSSVISISSSGRVNELSQRVTFTDIINWIDKNFEKIQNGNSNEFLDSFAKRIDLNEIIASGVEPNSILIETSTLINALENNNIYFYRSKSKKVCIKDGFKNKLILGLEKIYDLSKLSDANANLFQVNGLGKNNVLKINKKTISIEINILKRLNIEDDGKELSLQDYIKKHKLYSVTFTDPQYMYFMGYCFQDRSGISDIDNILDILVNQDNFTVKAEKEPEDEFLTENSTQFSSNSIFGFVENLHRKDDYIFCDDLGDEWADHITMNLKDKSINFIHSKYNDDVSLSASKLHDVVGQAIKNIGNMHFSRDQFINKKLNPKLMKVYTTSNSVRTNISRVRKGNLKDFESKLDSLLKNHSLSRKCILCCLFLSKEQIGNEFKKIKQGKNTKGNVTQLLWIISSFSHVVKEMNIVPVIYCRS